MASRKKQLEAASEEKKLKLDEAPKPVAAVAAESKKNSSPSSGGNFVPEPRMTTFMRGAKIGAMKKVADELAAFIAGPIKEKIVPLLKEKFPGFANVVDPAVELIFSCVILLGFAELAAMGASMLPVEDKEKMADRGQLIAQFLREYAGEKAGEGVVEAAMTFLPFVLESFKGFSTQDLLLVAQGEAAKTEAETEPELQPEPATT